MKQSKSFWLGTLLSIFGAVSAIVQIAYLPSPEVKILTYLIPFGLLGLIAFFLKDSKYYQNAVSALANNIKENPDEIKVDIVRTKAELKAIIELDKSSFPDLFVDSKVERIWMQSWNKYNKSLCCIKYRGNILGYLSFWPLSKKSYNDFINGKRIESEISFRCLKPPTKSEPETFWYIGGILLVPRLRRTRIIRKLVLESTRIWLSNIAFDSKVSVCALAYSPQGESILRKFGFFKFASGDESRHNLPVYIKEFVYSGSENLPLL